MVGLSFTTWDGIGAITPSGLTSWTAVLADPGLPHALWVTFLVMALSWLVQTPVSLLIGVFLAGRQRYRGLLAVLYFIPLLLSSAAIAITYKALLDPNFGLGAGLGIPLLQQDWLGQAEPRARRGRLRRVLAVHPVPLADLPGRGAADPALDVRGRRARRRRAACASSSRITLPQLKYTIIASSTLILVGSLTYFDLIFVLTGGGPADATRTLALDMYKRGFQANLMGPASAIAVILVLVGLALALFMRRLGGDGADSQLEGA